MPVSSAADRPVTLPLTRDGISWRIHGDGSTALGASTALLLQVAHPSIAAGVAQHSNFEDDPWSRLYRTIDTVLKLNYGTSGQVQAMRRRLATRHAPITGVAGDGTPYDARDTELGFWVWATLVHTAVSAYQLVHGRLRLTELEAFYRESSGFAAASGVPVASLPATWHDFLARYEATIAGQLRRTPECVAVAETVFRVPSPPVIGRLGGRLNRYLAAAMLPASVRAIYGLRWDARRQRRFERLMAVTSALLRAVPRTLREYPVVLVIDHDLFTRLERGRTRRRATSRRRARSA